MTDREKAIETILDAEHSSNATKLLIKSLFQPEKWKWTKQWILDYLKIKEFQWRVLSAELKENGYLMYRHISTGKSGIKRELDISFYGFALRDVDNQQDESDVRDVENQHNEQGEDLSTNLRDVDPTRDDRTTHIVPSTIPSSKSFTADTICVDLSSHDKPTPRKILMTDIPADIRHKGQLVFWRYDNIGGNITKVPYKNKHTKAKVNDPKTWISSDEAEKYEEHGMDGIGFVLTESDPFIVIDLDKCIEDDKINEFAQSVIDYFKSYTEISPSGKGLHIVIKGEMKKAIVRKGLEVYSKGRYICFTGNKIWDYDINTCQKEIDELVKKYGKKDPEPTKSYPKNFEDNGEFTMPKQLILEGNRNNGLAKWCGVLKTKIIDENKYWYWVYRINSELCSPPLPETEVKATAGKLWRNR